MEKHFDFSPYNYTLRNPLIYIDPDGRQIEFTQNMLNIYYWVQNVKQQSEYWNSLSLVGKEEYSKRYVENMGVEGRVEATGDEMIIGGLIGSGIKGLIASSKKVLSSLAITESQSLISTELKFTKHAFDRMLENEITQKMVEKTVEKGRVFWDPKNNAFTYILENKMTSGKSIVVGKSTTGKITTTYLKSANPIKKRYIELDEFVNKIPKF